MSEKEIRNIKLKGINIKLKGKGYSDSLKDKILMGVSDLSKRIFFYAPKEERVIVTAKRAPDNYEYDIDWNKSEIPFQNRLEIVSQLQEVAKTYLEAHPQKNNYEVIYGHYYPDPFGIKRLVNYLQRKND